MDAQVKSGTDLKMKRVFASVKTIYPKYKKRNDKLKGAYISSEDYEKIKTLFRLKNDNILAQVEIEGIKFKNGNKVELKGVIPVNISRTKMCNGKIFKEIHIQGRVNCKTPTLDNIRQNPNRTKLRPNGTLFRPPILENKPKAQGNQSTETKDAGKKKTSYDSLRADGLLKKIGQTNSCESNQDDEIHSKNNNRKSVSDFLLPQNLSNNANNVVNIQRKLSKLILHSLNKDVKSNERKQIFVGEKSDINDPSKTSSEYKTVLSDVDEFESIQEEFFYDSPVKIKLKNWVPQKARKITPNIIEPKGEHSNSITITRSKTRYITLSNGFMYREKAGKETITLVSSLKSNKGATLKVESGGRGPNNVFTSDECFPSSVDNFGALKALEKVLKNG